MRRFSEWEAPRINRDATLEFELRQINNAAAFNTPRLLKSKACAATPRGTQRPKKREA